MLANTWKNPIPDQPNRVFENEDMSKMKSYEKSMQTYLQGLSMSMENENISLIRNEDKIKALKRDNVLIKKQINIMKKLIKKGESQLK